MSDYDDWQAAQHADELNLQHRIDEALDAAAQRPLTEDERRLLAWGAGRTDYFRQERA